jgi:hypothetical protein
LEISDSLYMELCRKREEELSLKEWVAMRTHAQVSRQSQTEAGASVEMHKDERTEVGQIPTYAPSQSKTASSLFVQLLMMVCCPPLV